MLWADAHNLVPGWHDISDIAANAREYTVGWSAGYLIAEDGDTLAISVAVNQDFTQAAGGITCIPKGAIIWRRPLTRDARHGRLARLISWLGHRTKSAARPGNRAVRGGTGGAAAARVTPETTQRTETGPMPDTAPSRSPS